MRLIERQQRLDQALLAFHFLWHPQPFCELRPAWADTLPELAATVLALPDAAAERYNDNSAAALDLIARYFPEVCEIKELISLPLANRQALPKLDGFWDWEIPGRKRAQIEAFVSASRPGGGSLIDWCGGKGHLGRLLALAWQRQVHSLDFDAALCDEGGALARRAGVDQHFICADALQVDTWPKRGQHAVALHACGALHRRLIARSSSCGVSAVDIAPCCYYRGMEARYQPMSDGLSLRLTRDDARLAVTETVTARTRQIRWRDQGMAWKLGFDAYRRSIEGPAYRSFKPVPEPWLRAPFSDFMAYMTSREGLPALSSGAAAMFEAAGGQRRGEVVRYSIIRHAFRRAVEIWLALDAAAYLENHGYTTRLTAFCERELTPRNLLISARLA